MNTCDAELTQVSSYRGIAIYQARTAAGGVLYCISLGLKFMSSPSVNALKMMVDEWWKLRRN